MPVRFCPLGIFSVGFFFFFFVGNFISRGLCPGVDSVLGRFCPSQANIGKAAKCTYFKIVLSKTMSPFHQPIIIGYIWGQGLHSVARRSFALLTLAVPR